MLVISLARRDDKKEPEKMKLNWGFFCVWMDVANNRDTYDYDDRKVIEYLKKQEEWCVMQKGSLLWCRCSYYAYK